MYNNIVYIFLDIIGLILIIKWMRFQIKEYKSLENKLEFFRFGRFKFFIISMVILLIPLIVINFTAVEEINHLSVQEIEEKNYIYAI